MILFRKERKLSVDELLDDLDVATEFKVSVVSAPDVLNSKQSGTDIGNDIAKVLATGLREFDYFKGTGDGFADEMEGVSAVIAVNECAVERSQNGGAKDRDVADVDALALFNVADEFEAAEGFEVLIRVIHLLKMY